MYERLYRSLYRIRRIEEEVARVYPTDKIKSPVHLSIGQEAVSVGVCEALGPRDVVFGTYRGHALYLAIDAPYEQPPSYISAIISRLTLVGNGQSDVKAGYSQSLSTINFDNDEFIYTGSAQARICSIYMRDRKDIQFGLHPYTAHGVASVSLQSDDGSSVVNADLSF